MVDTAPRPDNEAILLLLEINKYASQSETDEFIGLAQAAGVVVHSCLPIRLRKISAQYFVGSGKAQEICDELKSAGVRLLIVNKDISPVQERELERLCEVRVLGRSGLILDIFARSAHTYEGKLQVELAQLTYLSTRLVRGWTHLERQKGGIGLRGPGEKQLETDRRLGRQRIKQIKKKIEKIKQQRQLSQHRRQKNNVPTVVLVGYTNAGKSALFNGVAGAQRRVANKPFATLDPCLRRVVLDDKHPIVLSDTVGFVHNLPSILIDAFHATLHSVSQAQLLLHVVDLSHPDHSDRKVDVENILQTIHAEHIPSLLVFNKIDQVEQATSWVDEVTQDCPEALFVSAKTGLGVEQLKLAIVGALKRSHSLPDTEEVPYSTKFE